MLLNTSKRVVSTIGAVLLLLIILLSSYHQQQASQIFSESTSAVHRESDIQNQTLGFEKIFVVGLPSRTDRRDGMILQAALSDLSINFIDGLQGSTISDKAIPKTTEHKRPKDATIGSWRAHMNAIQQVVHQNLSSALIIEDDIDWDVRIKDQLMNFARSSNVLIQPLEGSGSSESYADPTYPVPGTLEVEAVPEFMIDNLPQTKMARSSPYGDNWDMIWLGHCGMQMPSDTKRNISLGRVIQQKDSTVAEKRYLWAFDNPITLKEKYPEHTRVVHHAFDGVCSLAYAISQQGARKLLFELGLKDMNDAFDIQLRFYCQGGKGRSKHSCLTVQPSLFNHHRVAGPNSAASDISNHGTGFREKSSTDLVRWSVRMNAERILAGNTDYLDQYPDAS